MNRKFNFSATKVGMISLARPLFDVEYANCILKDSQTALKAEGFDVEVFEKLVMSEEDARALDSWLKKVQPSALIVQIGTFADASVIMEIASGLTIPLLLWAVVEPSAKSCRLMLNSFCGLNLAAYALVHSGHPFNHVYGNPDNPGVLGQVCTFLRGNIVSKSVEQTKILVVGGAPRGYYPSDYDPLYLKSTWGLNAVRISLEDVFDRANTAADDRVADLCNELEALLPNLKEIPAAAADKSIRGYLALRDLLFETGAAACAVECWPGFTDKFGGAACFAVGRLNAEGFPAACETEVYGALTMLLLQRLTGQPPYLGDLVHINEERQSVIFWHCGAGAPCLASSAYGVRAGVQPNRKAGLAFEFALKGGKITVAQLGRSPGGGFRMFIAQGEAIEAPLWFQGTGVEVKFDTPPEKIFDTVVRYGFGHHYALGYGNVAEELYTICRAKGIEIITL